MTKFRIVIIFLLLILLTFIFIICASINSTGTAKTDETTGGAVDTSPIPANSEFLNE